MAFPRAAQWLQRTLQPQALGYLLLPRHAKLTSITDMSQSGSGAATLTSSMTYDALHHLLESFDNLGNLTSRTYDADGNLTSVKDPLNHTITYTYNAINQLVGVTNALSNTVTYTYNADGRRTGITDPLSQTTTSTYDRQGRVLTVEAPNAGVATYTYDVAGNLLSLTDPDNYTTTYSYNAINEMVSTTNAMGHQSTYAYNAAGLLTSTTDADGRTITYGYDAIGERTSETWVSGSYTATYDYNAAGLLTLASDPNSTYTYTYDNSGRETSVSNAGTPGVPTVTLSYTYDDYGDRTTLTDSLGGKISYSYDNDLRMSRLSLYTTSLHTLILDAAVTFSYNGASLVTGVTQGLISSSLSYDNANELTNIKDIYSGTTLANYTYGYDAAGELTSYQDNSSSSLTYGYDSNGELTNATGTLNGSSYSVSYSYDANGNRNMTGYSTGSGNELLNDGTYSYTYDNNGNMLTQTEISTGTVTNYTWDYRNRLTEVKVETSGATVLNDEKFAYDVNNNRIGVSLNGTQQLHTVYDGKNPYMDFNGSGTLTQRYLTHPKALSQFYGQVSGSGTAQWFLTDNINSIRQVVSTSGSVLDAITYDPYGNILNQSNSANAPRFMYTGGAYDLNANSYQFDARYYNPAAGRFVSQDPASFTAGDMNLYVYTFNHPTSASDPSGLWSWGGAWGGATGGGLYGMGVGAIVGTFIFPGVGTALGAGLGGGLGAVGGFFGGGFGTQSIANSYCGANVSLTFEEQFAFGMVFVGAPVGTVAGFVGPAAWAAGGALLSYIYSKTVGSVPNSLSGTTTQSLPPGWNTETGGVRLDQAPTVNMGPDTIIMPPPSSQLPPIPPPQPPTPPIPPAQP